MRKLIYDPAKSGNRMRIVCFVSGSGTNYREIVNKNPAHRYTVFTNRGDCGGVQLAQHFGHPVVTLSHVSYLKEARKLYGAGKVPRNCRERIQYEKDACERVEEAIGGQPDLVCLAGFDQWNTDWLVERYYPRILNVHPGDTTKDYAGLHWIPSARAIIAGETEIRSTLFFVDKSEDKGPVLLQSRPLDIEQTVRSAGLTDEYSRVKEFLTRERITDYPSFRLKVENSLLEEMIKVCNALPQVLKEKGDWEIYPLGVDMIARGKVALEGRRVYLDEQLLPEYGYRPG